MTCRMLRQNKIELPPPPWRFLMGKLLQPHPAGVPNQQFSVTNLWPPPTHRRRREAYNKRHTDPAVQRLRIPTSPSEEALTFYSTPHSRNPSVKGLRISTGPSQEALTFYSTPPWRNSLGKQIENFLKPLGRGTDFCFSIPPSPNVIRDVSNVATDTTCRSQSGKRKCKTRLGNEPWEWQWMLRPYLHTVVCFWLAG